MIIDSTGIWWFIHPVSSSLWKPHDHVFLVFRRTSRHLQVEGDLTADRKLGPDGEAGMWPLDYPIYSLPQWNDGWRRCFTGHMDEDSRKLHPSLKSRSQVQTLSHALALELTIAQGKPTQACWECWGDDESCFTHPENDILSHLPVKTTNNRLIFLVKVLQLRESFINF